MTTRPSWLPSRLDDASFGSENSDLQPEPSQSFDESPNTSVAGLDNALSSLAILRGEPDTSAAMSVDGLSFRNPSTSEEQPNSEESAVRVPLEPVVDWSDAEMRDAEGRSYSFDVPRYTVTDEDEDASMQEMSFGTEGMDISFNVQADSEHMGGSEGAGRPLAMPGSFFGLGPVNGPEAAGVAADTSTSTSSTANTSSNEPIEALIAKHEAQSAQFASLVDTGFFTGPGGTKA